MNKSDLIEILSEKAGLTKNKSNEVIDIIIETFQKSLSKGKKVTIVGLGTFVTVKRKSRTGRNPRTGAEIKIPAKKVAKFKAGSALNESVNNR